MTNERLRAAIPAAGYDLARLAADLGVDPKTVERWISGRVPHRSHRMAAAVKLGKSDGYLWPSTFDDRTSQSATEAELIKLYPSRGAVPVELWLNLLTGAQDRIDVLVYAGSFLHDSIPGFVENVCLRAASGVQVRVLIGDHESAAVALRGEEELIGESMAARCKLSQRYFEPARSHGVDLRIHGTTLYSSIFRFDDAALINTHLYGLPAAQSPMLHVTKLQGGRLFSQYADVIDRVYRQSIAI